MSKPKEGRDYIVLSDDIHVYFYPDSKLIKLVDWDVMKLTLDDLKKLVKFIEKRQNELQPK